MIINYFDFIRIAPIPKSIFLIEFKGFFQRDSETMEQLVPRALLTINARHLLNPANPPFTFLFYYSGIFVDHLMPPESKSYIHYLSYFKVYHIFPVVQLILDIPPFYIFVILY